MTRARLALGALAAAFATHTISVWLAPRLSMRETLADLSAENTRINAWVHAPRPSPANSAEERPAPEIALSTCVYDLRQGPVRLTLAPWPAYASLTLIDERGQRFFSLSDREVVDGAIAILLVRAGRPHPDVDVPIVESATVRGVAVARRIAASADRFAEVQTAQREDICSP